MSTTAMAFDVESPSPCERLDTFVVEIGELIGQRNAIDGRLVEIVAEIDRDGLWGATGARSLPALVAWKTGVSPRNAEVMVAVAHRIEEFPRCAEAMREGRLSLDQVGVVAEHAADGSDEHYAQFAESATVTQLRTAVKLEPRPDPELETKPEPEPERSIRKTTHEDGSTTYKIRLPKLEAAKFDAAVASHQDALVADWRRAHEDGQPSDEAPPFPNQVDGFMSLVEAGWDTDVERRPHGQHTTVVVHMDAEKRAAALHLGLALTDDERRLLLCDATCEVWLEKHGQPFGAGRSTRTISRRLRRALEHRDRCCRVPGCGATRGLHAHHIIHWENGGETELHNLVLVCPYHHQLHHKRVITITGPADRLVVTDSAGRQLDGGSLARPPTIPPPNVRPCPGPTGERAQWWWYQPFEPPPTQPAG
ncbi:HNH endonuclease signature motif containing protein [Mycolicibacterium phocaicum]|uniref:HNH endonuclease signature motif containing protein n=1 Tax=Mycolicibacterium phocaicum TaxID=319706 RepID=UPI00138C44FF|nr:HNH endonuclease signature motif containing protein [Mycolicibacterium phocaicum]BBZ54861.1 HNH endonuclease [Mycolicibacterium phocaicum]